MKEFQAILDSYRNGQYRQMCEQIKKFGVYDFTQELEAEVSGVWSLDDGFRILTIFLRSECK